MPEELYKHNDNINYLLKRKLSFMLRYGMSFLFLLGFVVIASLYFIKAPDTLEGKFVLSSSNPPKSLLAKVNGRIIKINVSDLSKVNAGEVLMVLESVADANGIFALEDSLQFVQALIDSNCLDSLSYIETYNQPYLGEIQQTYEQFKKSNNELYLALTSGQYLQEKSIINNRLHNLQQTRNNLLNQKYIYEREYALANESWQADSTLNQQSSITKTELRNTESAKLQRKLSISNFQQNLINNENAINDIEQQLLVLEKNIAQQKGAFLQSYALLKTALLDWKSKYLLIAPFNGTISLHKNIYEGLNLMAGEPILYLIPSNSSWLCEILIAQQNFGKINVGQRSVLKFDSYNFEEFGITEGIVKSVSATPQEVKTNEGSQNLYLVQVAIDSSLQTSYHKTIQARFGLTGTANIILDDKNLLEKLFLDRFKSLFVFQ
ncbi:MAG: HlyD family efflux transporter periplasmic adaptor subunit [Bacteroidota bacterium]|nr:HlyD family efflux transporter periplasmic adaptor subunit [Bacteroidota bacterium]